MSKCNDECADHVQELLKQIEQLQANLTDAEATIKHLRDKAEFAMPEEMRGHFYNGQCPDVCDTIDGPCACGATHNVKQWLGKLNKRIKQLQSTTANEENERLRKAIELTLARFKIDCNVKDHCESILEQALKGIEP